MKKALSILAAFVMTLSLSTTAFAADNNEIHQDSTPKTADTTITAEITPAYTVTIPADTKIDFNAESTEFGEIQATAVCIEPGMKITVSVLAGELENTKDNDKKIPYMIKSGGNDFTSKDITQVGESAALTIDITKEAWKTAAAGSYSGTVIFTLGYGK